MRQLGPVYRAMCFLLRQTRRRLGGRQPLWGTGVTSLMPATIRPVAWSARMAASRPVPGPLTMHLDLPHAVLHGPRRRLLGSHLGGEGRALAGALEAVVAGADAHDSTLPFGSVMRDDRVVEGRLDVGDAMGDVAPSRFLGPATRLRLCRSPDSPVPSADPLQRRLRH